MTIEPGYNPTDKELKEITDLGKEIFGKYDYLDKQIEVTQGKINRVRANLFLIERALDKQAERQGWTFKIERELKMLHKNLKELEKCQNDLNRCKADRKLQKRLSQSNR